jgi:hypothetical protein
MPTTEIRNGISYTPEPEHRGYQPPPPVPEWRAPEVYAPALKTEGTVVQQAHKTILHARDEHRKHLAQTEEIRSHLSAEGYKARLAEFQNTPAAKAVDRMFEAVTARRDEAVANVAQVKRSLSPAGDAATEMRATRLRDRVIRTLDTKDQAQLFDAANQLLAGASREELGVLLQELPAYLQSRGSTTDWLDSAVAAIVPEFAAARARAKLAEQAYQIARTNVDFAHKSFGTDRPATIFVDPSKFDPDA